MMYAIMFEAESHEAEIIEELTKKDFSKVALPNSHIY